MIQNNNNFPVYGTLYLKIMLNYLIYVRFIFLCGLLVSTKIRLDRCIYITVQNATLNYTYNLILDFTVFSYFLTTSCLSSYLFNQQLTLPGHLIIIKKVCYISETVNLFIKYCAVISFYIQDIKKVQLFYYLTYESLTQFTLFHYIYYSLIVLIFLCIQSAKLSIFSLGHGNLPRPFPTHQESEFRRQCHVRLYCKMSAFNLLKLLPSLRTVGKQEILHHVHYISMKLLGYDTWTDPLRPWRASALYIVPFIQPSPKQLVGCCSIHIPLQIPYICGHT